jgi:NitT/TauT family transport system permease protein
MRKLLSLIVILALWQTAALLADSVVLPGPVATAAALYGCADLIMIHGAHSLYRVLAGIATALAAGVPLGILMGYNRTADRVLAPFAYLAGPVPKVAMLPLFMLFMGIGEWPKLFIIFIVMVFQVILSVRDSLKALPAEYFIPYYAAKAGTGKITLDILLPASLTGIFTAVRIGIATAVSVLFFAETFGTRYGMGFFIMDSWVRLEYARMYGGIAVLGVLGYALAFGLDFLEKKICKWK